MGEDILQELINYCLSYIAKIKLPKKRYVFRCSASWGQPVPFLTVLGSDKEGTPAQFCVSEHTIKL